MVLVNIGKPGSSQSDWRDKAALDTVLQLLGREEKLGAAISLSCWIFLLKLRIRKGVGSAGKILKSLAQTTKAEERSRASNAKPCFVLF